jgi:prepilin-type N-terminal cleavage/methylation domain-containing protein
VRTESIKTEHGFSLLELLVTITILTVGLLSLAQVLAIAVAANASAGRATYAALLAAQKIEDLRAEPWESLEGKIGEFADALDRTGTMFEGASAAAAFTRQWSIDQLPTDPENTVVIQVLVRAQRDETRIVTVRTRTSP